MLTVSATKLRNNLFEYLDKVASGETIVIQRNNKEVARLISTKQINWRDKMTITPRILVSPEELIQPMEVVWEDYL